MKNIAINIKALRPGQRQAVLNSLSVKKKESIAKIQRSKPSFRITIRRMFEVSQ